MSTSSQGVVDALVQERNGSARDLVAAYEKRKKHILRELRAAPASFEAKIEELTAGCDIYHMRMGVWGCLSIIQSPLFLLFVLLFSSDSRAKKCGTWNAFFPQICPREALNIVRCIT